MSLTKITDSVVETFSRWFRVNNTTGALTSVIPDLMPSNSTLYPGYMCRAWVNFNGTGTVAIRGSGNVSSITDNGTGTYIVNFTIPMPDTNYSCAGSARTTNFPNYGSLLDPFYNFTVNSVGLVTVEARVGWSPVDAPYIGVQIFR